MGRLAAVRFRCGACLLFASTAFLAAQDPVVRTGAHFEVHLHADKLPAALAGKLADEALATAERAWTPAQRWLQLVAATPFRVHVYAAEAPFRAVQKEHGKKGLPESFARLDVPEAHVLLWPALAEADLAAVGFPDTTTSAIVYQAAQVLAASRSASAKQDPWLASVFGYAVLEAALHADTKPGTDPMYDSRRAHFAWLLAQGQDASLRPWLLRFDEASADERDHREQAKCLFAQGLAQSGGDWARKLLAAPGKSTSTVEVRTAALQRCLGSDWTKTEARFAKLLRASPTRWYVQSPSVGRRGDRFLLVGTKATASTLNAVGELPKGDYRVCGRMELTWAKDDDGPRVQVDWDGESLLGVFFEEHVRLGRWRNGAPIWEKVAESATKIDLSKPFEFRVEVRDVLLVFVDDVEVLRAPYAPRKMRGDWSVAKNARAVWIENLRCEPIPAKR